MPGAVPGGTLLVCPLESVKVRDMTDRSEREVPRAEVLAAVRDLLAGRITGRDVWTQLRAMNRVGVTRGTLEAKRDPLAIV